MEEQYHFYRPADGHGLPHDPLNAIVGPRPIGWVSTVSEDGVVNLAPYSFFNAFNYRPPIIGFSSTSAKDSLRNVRATGEFVWNLATRPNADRMNATSEAVSPEVDEFALVGLTPQPSTIVAPPRVAESPVHFERVVSDIVRLRSHRGDAVDAWLVLGEVVGIHIQRKLLKDGIFDTFGAGIILRAGGPSAYLHVTPQGRFDIFRPGVKPEPTTRG
ncbi:flavin reductase family protein [Sphingomonas sp. BIUV-7]|uniref:Flavin reductase family protein n=1 Tax=Sphingomonas natans TaxID=3063330 RepID=A0ABT8Y7C6_9SPHN|nr:flavin reductase family protein [Sphingomonas sp. BIUV-7]MDO6414226.1 flavin reductase family protein [Sphingomonas sp. BIUV-7]